MTVSARAMATGLLLLLLLLSLALHAVHPQYTDATRTRSLKQTSQRDDGPNPVLGDPGGSTSTTGSPPAGNSSKPLNASVITTSTTTTTTPRDFCDTRWKFRCRSGQCIPKSFRCDDSPNCDDKSDEEHCYTPEEESKCRRRQFYCRKEDECIPRHWMCDGDADCLDGSDEVNCTSEACLPHQYHCRSSGGCISNDFVCNGEEDCDHGEDEEECGKTRCKWIPGHFQCKSGDCVPPEKLCNGQSDCADGSDEGGRCNTTCQEDQCSHQCFMTPRGPHCMCHDGYLLNQDDDTTCEDVDECEGDMLVCDQYCSNLPGGFRCRCNPYYLLQQDNVTCRSKETGTAFLVVAQQRGVQLVNLDSHDYKEIYSANDTFLGVAYDPVDHRVYWSTPSGVYRAPLEQNVLPTFIVQQGVGMAEGLAVDWVGRNLYMTDSAYHQILVCLLDGVDCHVLLKDLPHPRAIQLDMLNSYVYWTDVTLSVIERVGMDGSDRTVIVSEGLLWPNALALDQPAQRLYWMDAKHDTAYSVTTDGSERKHLATAIVYHPFSLAVWEEHLYWTDWNQMRVQSCIKRDGRHVKTILKGTGEHQYFGLSLYHPAMYNQGPNPCITARCSHLCLLSPTSAYGYSCVCPTGTMTLSSDLHTCRDVENRTYPLVASTSGIYRLVQRLYGRSTVAQWHAPGFLLALGDLDYDPTLEIVVVSDVWRETIIGISLASGISRTIANNTRAVGLAVDWLRSNVYWVDGKETVEVARLVEGATLHRRQVVQRLQDLTDIAVAPLLGYLYVSGAGVHPYILRCDLDGNLCTNIVFEDLKKPMCLTFDRDPDIKRLYWSDLEMRRIESVAEDGSDRRLMLDTFGRPNVGRPFSVLVQGMHIMWSLENYDLIFVAPKINMTTASQVTLGIPRSEGARLKLSEMGWRVPEQVAATSHACRQLNGNCSQLCLGNSKTEKVCACQSGYRLLEDGVTCEVIVHPDHLFMCHSTNSYVPASWRCDGSNDCDDGEDEEECEVEPEECDEGFFLCKTSGNCITDVWKCDGDEDCEDGEDEDFEECQNRTCGNSQWQCASGECIPLMWWCDHRKECRDGSDEVNCSTTCGASKFTCRDGRCIPEVWHCDGDKDCNDGSDEDDCIKKCEEEEFKCGDGRCVPKTALCDGINNCDDGEDEALTSCPEQSLRSPTCPTGQIPCTVTTSQRAQGSLCIPEDAVCDGKEDCPLGEDEDCYDCPKDQHLCTGSDSCIPISFLCDGNNDCGDWSDEGPSANCSQTTTPTSTTTAATIASQVATQRSYCKGFRCTMGDCISSDSVCDGVSDCLDGSDEGHLCETTCLKNGGCQQECRPHPHGRYCSCHVGFILADNGRDCLDYNECEEEERCGHRCVEMKGSYYCTCLPGYTLLPDRTTCKPQDGEEWAVLVVPGSLVNISHTYHVLGKADLPTDMAINSLAFDLRTNSLLYTDKVRGVVGSMAVNGKTDAGMEGMTLLSQRSNPQGLSFDPRNVNLYFSEFFGAEPLQENGRVERDLAARERENLRKDYSVVMMCGMNSKECGLIYRAVNKVVPSTHVAVNERKLFYCTNSLGQENQAEIVTSLLDGSGREVLWKNKVVRCGCVAADEGKRRVYWTDTSLNTVETVSWRGTQHRVVQKHQVHSPVGLTLTGDWVMWINKGGHDLVRCHKYDASVCQLKPLTSGAQALLVASPVLYDEADECDSAECTHLCTSHNKTAKCVCPVGLKTSLEQPDVCVELTACGTNLCQAGGVCEPHSDEDYTCRCAAGRRGVWCEVGVQQVSPASSGSSTVVAVILVLLILVLLALGLYWYKKRPFTIWKGKNGSQVFRFVNPAFGVMSDQAIVGSSPASGSSPAHSRNPASHTNSNPESTKNFENPFFKHEENQADTSIDSAVASATDSSTSINMPTQQVDLASPLTQQTQQPSLGEKQKPEWAFSPYNPLAL